MAQQRTGEALRHHLQQELKLVADEKANLRNQQAAIQTEKPKWEFSQISQGLAKITERQRYPGDQLLHIDQRESQLANDLANQDFNEEDWQRDAEKQATEEDVTQTLPQVK